jgi:hypothetical protein
MKILFAVFVSLIPLLAQAGTYIVLAGQNGVPVAASIDMPAEYVGIAVNIRSSAKNANIRLNEVAQIREKLIKAVQGKGNLEIQWVKTSFTANEGHSFNFSSSYGSESASQMFILGKIGGVSSIETVAKEIISVVAGVKPDGDASITTGNSLLAVADPERHRGKLLGLVREQIDQTTHSLGSIIEAEVSGLEAPVAVVQKNDREVTLFVPYRIMVHRK